MKLMILTRFYSLPWRLFWVRITISKIELLKVKTKKNKAGRTIDNLLASLQKIYLFYRRDMLNIDTAFSNNP